jgi:uncharacterized protein DUF2188
MSGQQSGNDNDRYVQPNKERGGWDVVKELHKQASAHTETKQEAINRARQIIRNQGGGELRIKNERRSTDRQRHDQARPRVAGARQEVGERTARAARRPAAPASLAPWRVYSKWREAKSSAARTRAAAKGSNRLERKTPGQRRSPV